MAQQWVDITTIDNNTPFSAVRWVGVFNYGGDKWFSEASGLTTDNMGWSDGDGNYGWFGAHRMNQDQYTCSFADNTVDPEGPYSYGVEIKDTKRNASGYYDTAVTISGTTYYEVDFSTWQGYKPLYAPFSNISNFWEPGEIYVLAGGAAISGNKSSIIFQASGGTDSTLEITADDDWTAVASDNWFTVSSLSGTSGTTAITITAPDYQGTTARTGTVTFSCNGDDFVFTVRQKKYVVPGQGTNCYFLGTDVTDFYLGDQHIDALYLGDTQIS